MTPARSGGGSLQGSLDLLILHTLTVGPAHGYAITQHIDKLSNSIIKIEHGSLYPALERLQRSGLVTSAWKPSPTGRRARYYTLTASGRRRLGAKVSEYQRLALAIARVLEGG